MKITDNFSISNLFISKDVLIFVDQKPLTLRLKVVKDYYHDHEWGTVFHLWTSDLEELQGMYLQKLNNNLDRVTLILFELGAYDQFRPLYHLFKKYLEDILPNVVIDFQKKTIHIGTIALNPEI